MIRHGSTVAGVLGALLLALAPGVASAQTLVIDDALTGSTKGTQHGGTLTDQGYRIDDPGDHITYEVPTIPEGYAEFSVRGLVQGAPKDALEDAELYVMYEGATSPDP